MSLLSWMVIPAPLRAATASVRTGLALVPRWAWLALAALLILLLARWHWIGVGEDRSAEVIAGLKTERAALVESLKTADKALRDQKADNDRRLEESAKSAAQTEKASEIAQHRANVLTAALGDYRTGLKAAAEKTPECGQLLSANVKEVCGR